MAFQIVVEFPNEETANHFCGQLSDGFGEKYCDFSFHRQKENTSGKNAEDWEEIYDTEGRRIYYVNKMFQ